MPFNSSALSECVSIQQLFEAKKKQYEDNLLHRRRKLADLYNREMDQWRREVLSKVETMQDRKER
jgi:hypothetical protein